MTRDCSRSRLALVLLVAFSVTGCLSSSSGETVDAGLGGYDASDDAPGFAVPDAATPLPDATLPDDAEAPDADDDSALPPATDAGTDATEPVPDASVDASIDAAHDAGFDAGEDAGKDASTCVANVACVPTNECHIGATACPGGVSTCVDQGTSLANGTACGTDLVCDNGTCVACTDGVSCTPTNPCHVGATSCSTGVSACVDQATNVADGTACGSGAVCESGACTTIEAPRARAPLSTSTVTSQKPTFHWTLASGTDSAKVDICSTRACTTVLSTFTATGSSGSPATALTKGLYYWRLHGVSNGTVGTATSPVWQFRVGARSGAVDTSWGTELDVNGDGFADVAVGANGTSSNAGSVYVYLGSSSGVAVNAKTILVSPVAAAQFGRSIASAGDTNGDGFPDLVVGAPGPGVYNVYVYFGSAAGLPAAPSVTIASPGGVQFGYAVSSAGDVNGDGYADIVVGGYEGNVYILGGGPSGPQLTPVATLTPPVADGFDGGFGFDVAGAGDINGDGYADVLVGSYENNTYTGNAYLYVGSATGLSTSVYATLSGSGQQNGEFGNNVAGGGDVNGDGYADVAVVQSSQSKSGVYVFLGGKTAPSTSSYIATGVSAVGAVDANGDGFGDLVTGAPSQQTMSLFLGSASGLSTTATTTVSSPAVSEGEDDDFGSAIAGAGDINGDGYGDVVIGAPTATTNTGSAYVCSGTSTGISSFLPQLNGAPSTNSNFGTSVY